MTIGSAQQLNDEDFEQLSAYLDGQLAAVERDLLEARLEREPTLRVALDELRATTRLLRELPPARPPRSFTLDTAQIPPRAGWWNLPRLVQLAGPLAAVLVVAVITLSVFNSGGMGSAPAAAPMAAEATTAAPALEADQAPGDAASSAARADAPAATIAPAATQAPAATEVPRAAEAPAAEQQSQPAAESLPEPSAAMSAALDETVVPGTAAGVAEYATTPELKQDDATSAAAANADTALATPAVSSPDTSTVATPVVAGAAQSGSPVATLALLALPLVLLGLGAWLWVVARRKA
jgi:hypothetical protein